jgi:phosphate transport system permease protein
VAGATLYPPLRPTPYGRLFREGQPWVWSTRFVTAILVLMVVGIVALILVNGLGAFWPRRITRFEMKDGTVAAGEEVEREVHKVGKESRPREEVRLRYGNRDQRGVGGDFGWIALEDVVKESQPEDLLAFERVLDGPAYGRVREVIEDGKTVASGPDAFPAFERALGPAAKRREAIDDLKADVQVDLDRRRNKAAYARKRALMDFPEGDPRLAPKLKALDEEDARLQAEQDLLLARRGVLDAEDARWKVLLEDGAGVAFRRPVPISSILRVDEVNRIGPLARSFLFMGRTWRFVTGEPRDRGQDGGIWPAIFGTMLMTLLMTIFVVPFGVMAALYLREYARQGPLVSTVRIAVNNLAGVPSIVFGIFGLGFFCQTVGGWIDHTFYPERLPSPTYGGGGLLWASATLALLTLPVVIVATEEALAAVPKSLREAAIACGASKWQTIRRIVLPHASPGILTGMILAMARGAGEVAPLMLTGVAPSVEQLPIDGEAPYLHFDRKIMHAAYQVFHLGAQSPNIEATRPLVYSTALVLLALVLLLNVGATMLRNRLRRKFRTGVFG